MPCWPVMAAVRCTEPSGADPVAARLCTDFYCAESALLESGFSRLLGMWCVGAAAGRQKMPPGGRPHGKIFVTAFAAK